MGIDQLKPSQIRRIKKCRTPREMQKILIDLGFTDQVEEVGSYSTVFSKSNINIVIKITSEQPDPCWAEFANFVRRNPNPHFPKIGNVKKMTISGKRYTYEYFWAFMEKLEPLRHLEHMDLDSFIHGLLGAQQTMRNHSWDSVLKGDKMIDQNYPCLVEIKKKLPDFILALDTLYTNIPKSCYPDIHSRNVMTRNGVPIIIDPYMD